MHPSQRFARAQRFTLGLAVALLALPAAADPPPVPLRTPAAFAAVLARYDATPPGPLRDALAPLVDATAAQRYATVSRLFWYTSLPDAQLAARAQHKPILALRMLGRLDEDLSCANSRFFRSTLYANAYLSAYLRDNFILYWSSERPVPVVTIDYGDGRKLVRTLTGNSAHYVLDEDGTVLDVLPGLYAPLIFRAELAKSLVLAKRVRGMRDGARTAAVVAYHRAGLAATAAAYAAIRNEPYDIHTDHLADSGERYMLRSAVSSAQQATVSKMVVEVRDLQHAGLMPPGALPVDDIAQWATIGQVAWDRVGGGNPHVLDDQSRALVEQLHTAGPTPTTPAELAHVIARYEQHVMADTAVNDFRVRVQIRNLIVNDKHLAFDALNARIYDEVFATPRSDAWLGLLPRTDFSGLPGDGVVVP